MATACAAKWYGMLSLSLGYKITPLSFIKIKIFPFSATQFPGPDKQQRGKTQGTLHDKCATESLNRSQ